jgi:predicted metal-dependent peptidase
MNALAEKRLVRARSILIQSESFLGFLSLNLLIVERPDVETAATDGAHFFYNAEYVLSLSDAELIWLWAHEVGHCMLSHHARLGDRDLGEANIAADIALNHVLDVAKLGKRPDGMWNEPEFAGMGFEEIYAERMRRKRQKQAQQQQPGANGQQQPQGAGQSQQPDSSKPGNSPAGAPQPGAGAQGQPGAQPAPAGAPAPGNGQAGQGQPGAGAGAGAVNGFGGIMKPGKGTQAECAESEHKWQVATRQAAAIAKAQGAGTMPGAAGRAIETLNAPAVDYAELLRDLINSRVAVDYSFSRPNRRLIGMGIYLPGIVADAIDHLVFAVDTSGSIDQTMLANAASEIIGAMESGKVRKLTVIFADAKVCAVQEFEIGDEIKLVPAGGGGTRFAPTFNWIEEHAPDATAIIYLTDMKCSDWGIEPAAPVYWAVHGDSRAFPALAKAAPFGDAVYIGRLG